MSRLFCNIFIIIFLLYSPSVFSNESISAGVKSISGTVSYHQSIFKTASITNRSFSISPKFLYFINNHIGLGGLLGYTQNKSDTSKFIIYTIGPIIRYYFEGRNIQPYIGLDLGYSKFKASGENVAGYHVTSNEAGGAAGFDYFVASNVAIETELKYTYTRQKYEYDPVFSFPAETDIISIVDYILAVGINVFFK